MISFPRLECWNTTSRVLCRVSLDILRDQFGASEEGPMQFVAQHRTAIQEAARTLIENGVFEEDGSILIRACDFPEPVSDSKPGWA